MYMYFKFIDYHLPQTGVIYSDIEEQCQSTYHQKRHWGLHPLLAGFHNVVTSTSQGQTSALPHNFCGD